MLTKLLISIGKSAYFDCEVTDSGTVNIYLSEVRFFGLAN